jgi:hypothetical protein
MNINANMTAHMANKMTFAGVTPNKEMTGVKDTQKTEQLRVDERIDELKKEDDIQRTDTQTQTSVVNRTAVKPREQQVQRRTYGQEESSKAGKSTEGKGQTESKELVFDRSNQIHHLYKHINPRQTAKMPNVTGRAMFYEGQPKVSNQFQFLSALRQKVDLEIRQYVQKQDNPIYTKRQLREIYAVLEQSDYKSFAKKTDSRTNSLPIPKSTKGTEGFNKYTLTEATNTLKIFEDEQDRSPLADYVLVG